MVDTTVERAKKLFETQYKRAPELVVSAPGRVNLIGEHTDYNDGFVMPLALAGMHTVVAGSKNGDNKIRLVTESNLGETYTEVDATKTGVEATKQPKWANYIKGVILQFFKTTEGATIPSFDLAVASDVPLGSGLSSSAALEVAVATFLEQLTGKTLDKAQKALLCQRAENEFVGVPCGCMDQFISVLGKTGHAVLLDCRSLNTTYVPLTDPAVVLLVINSNVRHELTGGEYAQRRAQCYEAVDVVKAKYPGENIKALRDISLEQLKSVSAELTPTVLARARHVIGEDVRTNSAVKAFERGDYTTAGRLMHESHVSLRDDYEVSCSELDVLVELAMQVPGVFGSRMTGGGFGGCTITLLQRDALDKTIAHVTSKYRERTGLSATCFATTPGEGAGVRQ